MRYKKWSYHLLLLCFLSLSLGLNAQKNYAVDELKSLTFDIDQTTECNLFHLVWQGQFGNQVLKSSSFGLSKVQFLIPEELRQQSGLVNVELLCGNKKIISDSFYLSALPAVGKIDAYIGPKTVNLDSLQPILLVNIPRDQFLNPIESNQSVYFKAQMPDGKLENIENKTQNLLAFDVIKPTEQKGKIIVGAAVDKANSKEQEVSIEEGRAAAVEIEILEQYPFADQRQQTLLATKVVRDAWENVVADGTNVQFEYRNGQGKSNYFQSFTVNGIASVAIQNPETGGTISVRATVFPDTKSNILSISYRQAVTKIEASYANGQLKIGPIRSRLGQLYTDGAAVVVLIKSAKKEVSFAPKLENGIAILTLPNSVRRLKNKQCEIFIAGNKKTMSLGDF